MAAAPPVWYQIPEPLAAPPQAAPPIIIDDTPVGVSPCDRAKLLGLGVPWSAPYTAQENNLCSGLIIAYEREEGGIDQPPSVQPVIPAITPATAILGGLALWLITR